jgi:hypothetical protein
LVRFSDSRKVEALLRALYWAQLRDEMMVARDAPPRQGRSALFLIAHEHAAYLRRRKESLPKLFIPDLLGELSQGLRRSGERCARFFDLPTPLVKLADPALDLPEFPRQPDLLG